MNRLFFKKGKTFLSGNLEIPRTLKDIIKKLIKTDCHIIHLSDDFDFVINCFEILKVIDYKIYHPDILISPRYGVWKWKDLFIAKVFDEIAQHSIIYLLCPVGKETLISKFLKVCAELYYNLEKSISNQNDEILNRVFLKKGLKESILEDIKAFIESYDIYKKRLKIPWKRGIMFYGPPGNGKTLLIKAVSQYFGLPASNLLNYVQSDGTIKIPGMRDSVEVIPALIRIDNKEFYNYGIKTLYSLTRDYFPKQPKPHLYYLEDIDKSVGKPVEDYGRINLSNLLQFLDGFVELDGTLIIATTNKIDELSEALINRPGRFDSIYEIGAPDEYQIKQLFNYHHIKIENEDQIIKELKGTSMAFAEEFVKVAKTVYKRNRLTSKEATKILNKMKNHIRKYQRILGF